MVEAQPSSKRQRADEPLTISEFDAIHRFLHDPTAPSELPLGRLGTLCIGTSRWHKRKVELPGLLGEVSVVDDRPEKKTAYAARARAGGCLSWWNPMAGTPWKFVGAFSSTLESLTPTGPTTVSQLGRFPPSKEGPHAPVEDAPGTMSFKDKACMATPAPDDPHFVSKPSAAGGDAPVTKVEVAKLACRCVVCGPKGSKGIGVGQLRLRFKGGRFDAFLHPACATAHHLPSLSHLEACTGFDELSPEQQAHLRSLPTVCGHQTNARKNACWTHPCTLQTTPSAVT